MWKYSKIRLINDQTCNCYSDEDAPGAPRAPQPHPQPPLAKGLAGKLKSIMSIDGERRKSKTDQSVITNLNMDTASDPESRRSSIGEKAKQKLKQGLKATAKAGGLKKLSSTLANSNKNNNNAPTIQQKANSTVENDEEYSYSEYSDTEAESQQVPNL